jgi:hypothetical protein
VHFEYQRQNRKNESRVSEKCGTLSSIPNIIKIVWEGEERNKGGRLKEWLKKQ